MRPKRYTRGAYGLPGRFQENIMAHDWLITRSKLDHAVARVRRELVRHGFWQKQLAAVSTRMIWLAPGRQFQPAVGNPMRAVPGNFRRGAARTRSRALPLVSLAVPDPEFFVGVRGAAAEPSRLRIRSGLPCFGIRRHELGGVVLRNVHVLPQTFRSASPTMAPYSDCRPMAVHQEDGCRIG